MQLFALGTGNSGAKKNWHSNFVVVQNGKYLLIDCGSDIRFSMDIFDLSPKDIDAVYVSHLHADHIGGLEWLGQSTLFNPTLPRPKMYGEACLLKDLWAKSLSGGLEGLEGHKYTEVNGEGVVLSTYYDVHPVKVNSSFTWEGIKFDIVQSVHITAKYALCNSFGLMWSDPDTKERVYLTTDVQYSPEASMRAFYTEADHIFQDCETTPGKSGVHANYTDLVSLPEVIKSKMWLYHYQDNVVLGWEEWENKAKSDGFRGFLKTGVMFNRGYSHPEAGTIGNIFNNLKS